MVCRIGENLPMISDCFSMKPFAMKFCPNLFVDHIAQLCRCVQFMATFGSVIKSTNVISTNPIFRGNVNLRYILLHSYFGNISINFILHISITGVGDCWDFYSNFMNHTCYTNFGFG